jgi:hypothetical protein
MKLECWRCGSDDLDEDGFCIMCGAVTLPDGRPASALQEPCDDLSCPYCAIRQTA